MGSSVLIVVARLTDGVENRLAVKHVLAGPSAKRRVRPTPAPTEATWGWDEAVTPHRVGRDTQEKSAAFEVSRPTADAWDHASTP